MSRTIRCIIVDDEPPAIRLLLKFIEQVPGLECLDTTTSAVAAISLVEHHRPDIVFLDIQMPELTGIQLSGLINDKASIIFTTAYPQFALDGFNVNALDYLLKPIAFPRFLAAIEKFQQLNASAGSQKNVQAEVPGDYFFVKTDGKKRFQRIVTRDVNYIESVKNFVILHTDAGQVVTYSTLKYYEENLPRELFVKIHKSYLVALARIERTDANEVWIAGKCLPLGDTYKHEFFQRIEQAGL